MTLEDYLTRKVLEEILKRTKGIYDQGSYLACTGGDGTSYKDTWSIVIDIDMEMITTMIYGNFEVYPMSREGLFVVLNLIDGLPEDDPTYTLTLVEEATDIVETYSLPFFQGNGIVH